MAKIFGQLEKAQLENTTSDTGSLPKGTATYRTDLNLPKVSNGTTMKTLVDTDTSQSLTNKTLDSTNTLSSPVVTGALQLQEISTPSTPSSGNGKVYFKSDGFLYQLNDDGTETKVGAGGGGGINYLSANPDAESNTTGYVTYADAAASRPVDGTGGSPTLTFTRTTSSPLRGTASFLITKDAANRQGEGVSYDFTINSADQAKVLQISFDYQIASGTYSGGTSSTDSDLIVYIYRTTATGRLIEPSVIKLDGGVVGVNYSYRGEFQTDSDATGYRLIVHCATTSASAYTVKMDNFIVGPSKNIAGAIVTPWTSFTPTGSWVTNTTYTGFYRRVGDTMEIQYKLALAGAPTSTVLSVNMPSGFVIDSTKIDSDTDNYALGDVSLLDSGSATWTGRARYVGTSAFEIPYVQASGTLANTTQVAPFTFANNDEVHINVSGIPIVGWGATATLGQDADTRVVAMRAQAATPTGPTDGSGPVVFGTAPIFDTHAGYSTSTGRYTVPVAGYYKVKAQINLSGTEAVNQFVIFGVYKNATVQQSTTGRIQSTTLDDTCHPFDCTVFANAGDLLDVRVNTNITGVAYNANANNNFIEITRMSGPAQIAASEKIVARATLTTAQTGITDKVIPFNSVQINTHGAFDAVTNIGRFTAPRSDYYNVFSSVLIGDLDGVTNPRLFIQKNGVDVAQGFGCNLSASTTNAQLQVSDVIQLNAGQYIDIFVDGDLSFSIDNTNNRSFVYIHSV